MLENAEEILTSLDKDFTGWRNWPEDQKKKLLEKLLYDFSLWRLPQQEIPPDSEFRYYVNLSGRGGSKAVWTETPILTSQGFKKMLDIEVGDKVFDEQGNPCNVTHISEIMHNPTCKITFSDNSIIYADYEHQWVTLTNDDRRYKYKCKDVQNNFWADKDPITTKDILSTQKLIDNRNNHCIPLAAPLHLAESELPIPPYVLGAWLGDGKASSPSICGIDVEVFQKIESLGVKLSNWKPKGSCKQFGMSMTDINMTQELRNLKVLDDKHIPDKYLMASYPQRLELLKGLLDTDGTFVGTNTRVSFSASNQKLAEDVFFLVCSLGMKPTIKAYQAKLYGVPKKITYKVSFTALTQVFHISRKADRIMLEGTHYRRNTHRMITGVSDVGILPVKCIAVDSPNSMYLAGKSLIPTHNTKLSSEEIRKRALATPNTRINLIAPTHSDARDTNLEGDSGVIAVCNPSEIKKYLKNQGQVLFSNGSRLLTFSAQEPERLRGKQSHYCFMDEFCAFEDNMQEILTQVQMSNRLGSDPKIYITTTPKPSKVLEDLISRPDTHLVVSGTLANPFLATPQVKELVERYANTAIGQQELFGQILTEQRGANWTREMIDNNRVQPDQVPELIRVIIAVDPSSTNTKRSDECGIMVAGMSADKHFYVLRDLSVKTTPQLWAQRVMQAFHQYHASTVVVEKSDGDLVKTILNNMDKTVPIRMLSHQRKGKTVRAEPIAQLYQQGRVHHVGYHKELENQLCSKVQGDSTSDDRHDALVYAVRELSQAGQGGQFISARESRMNQTRTRTGSPLQDMKRMQRGF